MSLINKKNTNKIMSFVRGIESDSKSIANDYITNLVALGLYNKFLAQYVVNGNDSALLSTAKAAAVVTGLEESKRIINNQFGYNLNMFK